MSLPSARPGQLQSGYWGVHDGTIDFCETNYQFTNYIAEFINTLSNLPIILLSIHGVVYARRAKLPWRVFVCYIGQSLIGVGSVFFHATLQHKFQVWDEIPMIWVTSILAWCAFETTLGYDSVRYFSPFTLALVGFNALVTLSCLLSLSPTIHEIGFGLLVTLATVRIVYILLLRSEKMEDEQPVAFKQAKGMFAKGIASFLIAFAVWNVDNLLCESLLQPLRAKVGYPASFFLEGHAYWHLGTGMAPFFCIGGATFLMLSLKEPDNKFHFKRSCWGLPYLVREEVKKKED